MVRPEDILLRVGARTLLEHGSLAVAGPGRGRGLAVPYTFARADASTCATFVDRNGLVRLAGADKLRLAYDTSVSSHVVPLEGSRTNVVLHNRDLTNAAWTKTNVTPAKDQVGVDGVASSASKITATAGNGTCLQAITLSSSARAQSAYVKRVTGSGVIEMTMDNGSTWTPITVTADWTRVTIPTQTLADPTLGFRIVTDTDAIAVDLVQNENGVFRSSPIPTTTAAVTRAADSLTVPFNFGPLPEMTVLARIARPVHADVSGTLGLGVGARLWSLGSLGTGSVRALLLTAARNVQSFLDAATTDATGTQAIPAGTEIAVTSQYRALTSNPAVAQDVGSGLSSFGAAAPGFSVFSSQTLRVGGAPSESGNELYGVLIDLIFARGLHSRDDMLAVS